MAREKKSVHKAQMTEGKRDIIRQLLEEYDIETASDIQISQFHEELETELGCHLAHIQVFHGGQKGNLYDQCHRETEFLLPEVEPPEKRVPQ